MPFNHPPPSLRSLPHSTSTSLHLPPPLPLPIPTSLRWILDPPPGIDDIQSYICAEHPYRIPPSVHLNTTHHITTQQTLAFYPTMPKVSTKAAAKAAPVKRGKKDKDPNKPKRCVAVTCPSDSPHPTHTSSSSSSPSLPFRLATRQTPFLISRALSAYMFFVQDWRDRIKSENPDVTFGEVGKLLGAKWKEMSPAEKKVSVTLYSSACRN
jgi:hypothetical protein